SAARAVRASGPVAGSWCAPNCFDTAPATMIAAPAMLEHPSLACKVTQTAVTEAIPMLNVSHDDKARPAARGPDRGRYWAVAGLQRHLQLRRATGRHAKREEGLRLAARARARRVAGQCRPLDSRSVHRLARQAREPASTERRAGG